MDINKAYQNIITQTLHIPDEWQQNNIRLTMTRFDLFDPIVSGNKWFKLQYYIQAIQTSAAEGFITFGGAYSNHLIAAAAAAQVHGIPAKALVRGLEVHKLTPTLLHCQRLGMELIACDRAQYQLKHTPEFINSLQAQYPQWLIIPEGGSGNMGIQGASTMYDYLPEDADIIICAVGTGTTAAGIARKLQAHQQLIVVPAIKNGAYLLPEIQQSAPFPQNIFLWDQYHFGGFGKHKPDLIYFMNRFYEEQQIPLDFVYNGKMVFGLFDYLSTHRLKDKRIALLHSGGLQGNVSIQDKLVY